MSAGDRVGIVLVSHSRLIAAGLEELAAQMAPSVLFGTAGGRDDGGVGTSLTLITAAIDAVDSSAGVAVLADLGSAILTVQTALEFLPPERAERVRLADAPLVEGAVAAAVAAETGSDLAGVVAAAEAAAGVRWSSAGRDGEPLQTPAAAYARRAVLVNAEGLHARPAAEFVRLAAGFDVPVSVNGRDAKSLLGIMSLGLTRGMAAEISTADERGRNAVDALADLIESGFGERGDATD